MMNLLYQVATNIVAFLLPFLKYFSPKMRLFVAGRRCVWKELDSKIDHNEQYIWVHTASLGEYEQAVPIMEEIRNNFPNYKIVLTFFSPSGYEVRKHNSVADITTYLPVDTLSNAKKFLDMVRPQMVFFIKYEFWPNYLSVLKDRKIPVYLISGIFRKKQLFFRWYGGFYRKALYAFHHFFVQNKESYSLLSSLGFSNITIHGDTRYNRVLHIVQNTAPIDSIEKFKNNTPTIVIGSSWIDDQEVYLPFINENSKVKYIIAPHNIKEEEIQKLINKIANKKVIRYTTLQKSTLPTADVLIIDTIGILTRIYAYADIAMVGGAFRTGLHNILEPAAYGIPVIIGPKYSKFQEAKDLVALGGCISVSTKDELSAIWHQLLKDISLRKKIGHINKNFVLQNQKATSIVIDYLNKQLKS